MPDGGATPSTGYCCGLVEARDFRKYLPSTSHHLSPSYSDRHRPSRSVDHLEVGRQVHPHPHHSERESSIVSNSGEEEDTPPHHRSSNNSNNGSRRLDDEEEMLIGLGTAAAIK